MNFKTSALGLATLLVAGNSIAAPAKSDLIKGYADLAFYNYQDALVTAKALESAVENLVNKPSDAAEVLAYYNREQYGEQKLFYGPQFSDTYSGLDSVTPYLDDKPNYERDYTTNTYVITNNFKNAKQNTNDAHKAFLPRMWSNEHNVNYMTFGNPLEFQINPEYSNEDELIQIVTEFRKGFASGEIDLKGYDKFLTTYGEYLIIEKPSFASNMKFMF